METLPYDKQRRILIVDDNPAIHDDFRKILLRATLEAPQKLDLEISLCGGDSAVVPGRPDYIIDSAFQGTEALEKVRAAIAEGRPYEMAFMDVRMPPGIDGIETTARLWQIDAAVQIVICTAFSDYTWEQTTARLGYSSNFLVLKKPFDVVEVQQLASAITEKWNLARRLRTRMERLEALLPICCYCKRVRNDQDYWQQVEGYFNEHIGVNFTHGVCPECYSREMKKFSAERPQQPPSCNTRTAP